MQPWRYRSQQPDHKTEQEQERVIFFNYTAAEFLALTEEKQCKLTRDFKALRARALIQSDQEEKRSALRSSLEQVWRRCAAANSGPTMQPGLI
jgi:hypothetical protein